MALENDQVAVEIARRAEWAAGQYHNVNDWRTEEACGTGFEGTLWDWVFNDTRALEASQAEAVEDAAHRAHCDQGEYAGSCKYGDADCPAITTPTRIEAARPKDILHSAYAHTASGSAKVYKPTSSAESDLPPGFVTLDKFLDDVRREEAAESGLPTREEIARELFQKTMLSQRGANTAADVLLALLAKAGKPQSEG